MYALYMLLQLNYYYACYKLGGPAGGKTSLTSCSLLCNQPLGYSAVSQYQQRVKKLQEVHSSSSLQGLSVPNNLKPLYGEIYFCVSVKIDIVIFSCNVGSQSPVFGLGFWVLNFGFWDLLYGRTFPDRGSRHLPEAACCGLKQDRCM